MPERLYTVPQNNSDFLPKISLPQQIPADGLKCHGTGELISVSKYKWDGEIDLAKLDF